jgi:formylglycine-generating enzyme required for sulfatase activity
LPASKVVQGTVLLTQPLAGGWKLTIDISHRPLEAALGQKIVYPGRPEATAAQDWLKMPVLGVSPHDARAYVAWLSETGKVPGARLCTDSEWERAARGADGRSYPSSPFRLPRGDANVDETYGRISGAYGPDEVGSHPRSRSPFGVDDMAGNAWEIVEEDGAPESFRIRGGCFYQGSLSARSTNRDPLEAETRSYIIGVRVCADVRPPTKGRP